MNGIQHLITKHQHLTGGCHTFLPFSLGVQTLHKKNSREFDFKPFLALLYLFYRCCCCRHCWWWRLNGDRRTRRGNKALLNFIVCLWVFLMNTHIEQIVSHLRFSLMFCIQNFSCDFCYFALFFRRRGRRFPFLFTDKLFGCVFRITKMNRWKKNTTASLVISVFVRAK